MSTHPAFEPLPSPTVVLEPTDEMARWARRLGAMLSPGSLAGTALVTPIAHFANRSFDFQAYLYAVFHRTALARAGHLLLMPLQLVALVATVALAASSPGVALLLLPLTCWYLALALRERLPLLGVVTTALVAALGALGWMWARAFDNGTASLHPAIALLTMGLLQALSHALEDVPPRVNGTSHWMTVRDFFARNTVAHLARAALMVVPGAVNELWASWRLLPHVVLDVLWRLGYARQRRERIRAAVDAACADGNPAIDFIGRGGTRHNPYMQSLP